MEDTAALGLVVAWPMLRSYCAGTALRTWDEWPSRVSLPSGLVVGDPGNTGSLYLCVRLHATLDFPHLEPCLEDLAGLQQTSISAHRSSLGVEGNGIAPGEDLFRS